MTTKTTIPGAPIKMRAIPVHFTPLEVFKWICDKQNITNPDHLTDARFRSLWYMAECTSDKLNALFAQKEVIA